MKMKPLFKKSLALLVAILFCMATIPSLAYIVTDNNPSNPVNAQTFFEHNLPLSPDVVAQEEVNKIFDSFNTLLEQTTQAKNSFNTLLERTTQVEQTTLAKIPKIYSSIEYPAFYAGVYNDNGVPTLVHVAQEDAIFPFTSTTIETYNDSPLTTYARSNEFNIKEAKFSLNELNEMMDLFSYYIGKGYDIITVSKKIKTNRVTLGIYQISDEKIQRIKDEISNSEIIDFENEEVNDYEDQLTVYANDNVSKIVSTYTNPSGQIVTNYSNGSFG